MKMDAYDRIAAEVGSRLSGTGTVAVVVVGMVLAVARAALLLHLSQPAGGLEDDC